MNKKIVLVFGGALLLVGAVAGAARLYAGNVAEVSRGPVHEVVVAQGAVIASAGVAEVRARTDGHVTRVLVREGDRVKAGQLLAEIDPSEIRTVLDRLQAERRVVGMSAGARGEDRAAAQAELKVAQAELARAEDHAVRIARLHVSGAESEQAAFDADRALDVARAHLAEVKARSGGRPADASAARGQVVAATASVAEAERMLARTKVIAPIAGIVLSRHIDEGDTVSPASGGLFEIADATRTEVAVEIEEPDALRIELGLPVKLTMPGGRVQLAEGKITRLSPRLQKRTIGADDARIRAEHQVRCAWVTWTHDGESPLPIGKRVEAAIQLPPHDVPARLPRAAVIIRDGRAEVHTARWPLGATRPVTLGAADDQFVEVAGLSPGDKVLVE